MNQRTEFAIIAWIITIFWTGYWIEPKSLTLRPDGLLETLFFRRFFAKAWAAEAAYYSKTAPSCTRNNPSSTTPSLIYELDEETCVRFLDDKADYRVCTLKAGKQWQKLGIVFTWRANPLSWVLVRPRLANLKYLRGSRGRLFGKLVWALEHARLFLLFVINKPGV